MKGLLLKDFLMIKKQFSFFLLVPAVFFAVSLFISESGYFSYYSVAIFSVLPISIIGYDEMYKWNKYEMILPISRKAVVGEKYIFTALLILPATFIESIIIKIAFAWSIADVFAWIALALFCGLIIPSVMLPVLMKFGYHKGKTVNMIVIAFIAALIGAINFVSISGDNKIEGTFSPGSYCYILAATAIVLFFVSYLIASKVYLKREF